MPRCNLTLKQKSQMIELSSNLTTEQLAKRFHVHPTTVTRTIKKQARILDQVARVNPNFKTVQTNFQIEQHDTLVLNFIQSKHDANEPITVTDVCDTAVACAEDLGREIKSTKGWWRRFKIRCNITKSRVVKNSLSIKPVRAPVEVIKRKQEEQEPQQATTPKKPSSKDLKKSAKAKKKNKKAAAAAAPVIDEQDQRTVKLDPLTTVAPSLDLQPKSPVSERLTQLNDLPVNNFEVVVTSSSQ